MFLSKLFQKKDDPLRPKPLPEIFKLENKDDFVFEMNKYVGAKCAYGGKLEALSGPERVFYVGQVLEAEVNNGGFSQFFYNSSGDFAGELVVVFQTIGAVKTAQLCQRAVDALGETAFADWSERQKLLAEVDDETEEILGACDDTFYDYEEDLAALNQAYVLSHRDAFT